MFICVLIFWGLGPHGKGRTRHAPDADGVIQTMTYEHVLIVGGGPAGAACAWALRRHGCEVLILDRAAFPRPKLCAGWITPDIWEDLACDATDYPYGLTTIRHLVLSGWGVHVRLPARQLAIRRIEFDHWLLRRSGARVITHHVRDIAQRVGGYVVDGSFFGRYLVGAGGTHCPVARAYFTDVNPRSPDALIVTQEEEFSYPYRRASRGWRERQLRVDNAFVVGDAAGLATADMGEGIAPAVRSGLLVADAIATGSSIDVQKIRRWSQPPLIARLLARAYG